MQQPNINTDTAQDEGLHPLGYMPKLSKALIRAGALILAITGFVFAVFFISTLKNSQSFYEALGFLPVLIGFSGFGLVPGLLLFMSGRHLKRTGPSRGLACVLGLMALPVFGLGVFCFSVLSKPLYSGISIVMIIGLLIPAAQIWRFSIRK